MIMPQQINYIRKRWCGARARGPVVMLWNTRLWNGCIGITTPARIRTAKTSLQRSSRNTTTLKPVGQWWLAYRYELSTKLGAIHRAYRVYRQVIRPASRFRTFRGAAYVTRSRKTARHAASFSSGSFKRSSGSFAYHYGKHGKKWGSARNYGKNARKKLEKVRGSRGRMVRGSPGGLLNRDRTRWHSFW